MEKVRSKETHQDKIPIAILIGSGSRLPAIIKSSKNPNSCFYPSIVVSHKKESDGIDYAKNFRIPAVYWNFVEWKNKTAKSRQVYMQALGYLVSQSYYKPELVVTAGWDLILTLDFLNFFKRENGNFNVINLHPAPLPDNPEEKSVKFADGITVPVLKGEIDQILPQVLKFKFARWGSTVHFLTEKVDQGPVILRSEVNVNANDTIDTLKKRLQNAEDQILPAAINLFACSKLKIENGKVKILDTYNEK